MDEMPVARPLSESGDCQIIVVYENKTVFHPVVFALRNNGFLVNVTGRQPSGNQNGRVIIIIPERGVPLDIVLDDNPGKGVMNKDLRIFLVPLDIDKKLRPDQPSSDIIFMDSNTVDYRVLMHIIDKFLGRIIAPETGSKAQPVQNDDTRLTADKNA